MMADNHGRISKIAATIFRWSIQEFKGVKDHKKYFIQSPDILFSGYSLYIALYKSKEFLVIVLRVSDEIPEIPVHITYRFCFADKNGEVVWILPKVSHSFLPDGHVSALGYEQKLSLEDFEKVEKTFGGKLIIQLVFEPDRLKILPELNIEGTLQRAFRCGNEVLKKTVSKIAKVNEIDTLLEDLNRLFCEGQDTDLNILVKGRQFHAHRIILKCRSPVFDRMLQHDMVEKDKGVVNVTDCNPDAFQDFLVYLYTGKLEQISGDYVHDLYYIGNKYEVKKLADACVNFMIQSFTIETFCDSLRVGLQHNEKILVESAIDFFRKNFKMLYRSEQWKQFLLENPVEALEISKKALE